MSPLRIGLIAGFFFCFGSASQAATPKEIETAIKNGTEYLKKASGENANGVRDRSNIGELALAGLALLESGTPGTDPVIKKITERVRDASFAETRTYQITLCLLYLDRLGEPIDHPLIQMLGVRLVAGQNAIGGWTYECIAAVPPGTERFLRTKLSEATLTAGKQKAASNKQPMTVPEKLPVMGKLNADVDRYRKGLIAADHGKKGSFDDNSNTQFGVLGVWTARKHGVPVEPALDMIEKRFIGTQTKTGGWPYSVLSEGSPSMTCAGLLGLATALGRREERTMKTDKPPAKKPNPPPGMDSNDPFFNPPSGPVKKQPEPPKPKPKARKLDARDNAVKQGLDNLAKALTNGRGQGKRGNVRDPYFLWSMERVGVIFGAKKIGNTDWYAYGADILIDTQNVDGSWGGAAGYGIDVETAFALLFLGRSNLARDLTAKVQHDSFGTELRAGGGPSDDTVAASESTIPAAKPEPAKPALTKPTPTKPTPTKPTPTVADPPAKPVTPAATSEKPKPKPNATSADIAGELFRSTGANWVAALQRVRDAKGANNTSALLAVIPLLDDDRKKQARNTLAERLCRMNATTLRGMLKASEAELRRAASLACAMKDDKTHIADLIPVLEDKDDDVVKAVQASLKSLTGKDFTTPAEWRSWYEKEKK